MNPRGRYRGPDLCMPGRYRGPDLCMPAIIAC